MSDNERELATLRCERDAQDHELFALFERRIVLAKRLREVFSGDAIRTERELRDGSFTPRENVLPREQWQHLRRDINAVCALLGAPLKLAYVGVEGSPAHLAAKKRFGAALELSPARTARDALDLVERRQIEMAVVPFETTSDGLLQSTLVELVRREVKIVELIELPLELHLFSQSEATSMVKTVYATPTDRDLCLHHLQEKVPVPIVEVTTAREAFEHASKSADAAAVGPDWLAESYDLDPLLRGVEDEPSARVRCAVVGLRPSSRTGSDATSFVFAVRDTAGALLDILRAFAERDLNLTTIQSRPMDGENWSYLFFCEIHGHPTDRALVSAFEDVKRKSKFFKILGTFRVESTK